MRQLSPSTGAGTIPFATQLLLTTKRESAIVRHALLAPKSETCRQQIRMADNTDVIQGTLDMLILKSLSLQPMHGFGVARRIEQISKGVFKVNPGSLLLAFQRMERDGLIDAEWRMSENSRRAKYYRLTAKGRKHLAAETTDWQRRVAAIARLLEA